MRTYRTVIVDEELSARQELAKVLNDRTEIDVVFECASGEDAVNFINKEHPDLVFIEVELPEISGFEVIAKIEEKNLPLIVFISSNKDFAMQAFEVEAMDYIQKPFKPGRIEKSLNRLNKRIKNGIEEERKERIGNLIQEFRRPDSLERFIIKQSGEYHLIRTADIIWVEADGNYSRIMTKDKKFMVRYTLSGFDEQLNPERFYRISRSQIVNLDYVVKIKDHIYGNYIVELSNGKSLKMSKNYKQLFEALKNF